MGERTHLTYTPVRSTGRTTVLGLAIVLASCGWQAQHEAAQDAVATPLGARSPSNQTTATQSYFGAEYEVQQSALRDAPLEPEIQAF